MSDPSAPEGLPPGGRPPVSVGQAVSWAFDRFKSQAAGFVGLAAVVTIVYVLQNIGSTPLQNIVVDCSNPETPGQVNACTAALGASAIVAIVVSLVFAVVAFIAQIGVQRAAIRATQGIPPTFSEMFTTQYLGRYILFMIVYAILGVAGLILCIIPGLLVIFFLQLGPYYILDKGMSVGEAVKASVNAVRRNVGPALIMTLVNALVQIVGGLLFGLLTLITLPFAALFTAHIYRQFNGERVV